MDFDNIASTQLFEGNTIDVIFPKKRKPLKRKSTVAVVEAQLAADDSPDVLDKTATQKSTPEQFTFTNENIFRKDALTSALFKKYFPPVLKLTDEELTEINDLYQSVQQQRAEQPELLTEEYVHDLGDSCLIERFLKDNQVVDSPSSPGGTASQSQPSLAPLDTSSLGS